MSNNREKAFYEACKKGCDLMYQDAVPVTGRLTWQADYTFGFVPDDTGKECMVFKGPGLVLRPHEPPKGRAAWNNEQKSDNSGAITRRTGSKPPTSRSSEPPGGRSGHRS